MTSTSVRFASRAAMRSHIQMTLIHLRSVLALACLAHLAVRRPAYGAEFIVYFGTGGRDSKGIYASRLDSKSGKLGPPELAAEVRPPSFVALHPNRRYLYAVAEAHGGAVSAFSIGPKTGKLTLLNTVSSKAVGPCYVPAERNGNRVFS